MKTEGLLEKIKSLAGPVAGSFGFELVEAEFSFECGRRVLRVYIDKPGGITVDDCEGFSREFSTILDVEDLIRERYSLEVSSPGLARPVRKESDFQRFIGRKVKIRTKEPVEGRKNFKATIEGASVGAVTVRDADGRVWTIPISGIEKANLMVEI